MRKNILAICVFVLFSSLCSAQPPDSASADSEAANRKAAQARSVEMIEADLLPTLRKELEQFPAVSSDAKDAVDLYSRRGDLHMFLAEFAQAEADYQQMVTLKPELDASHWRLGIAKYFAGHPEQAAAQFDKYNSFDNVDRENGIWRYLSHRKAYGREKAKEQLLKYEKDDRPPFKEVYRLFDQTLSPREVLAAIPETLPEASRDSRLFYSHLYIGLNHAAEGENDPAAESLTLATLNTWPRKAGFGPDYMWHVGRLQLSLLKSAKGTAQPAPKE